MQNDIKWNKIILLDEQILDNQEKYQVKKVKVIKESSSVSIKRFWTSYVF